MVGVLSEEESRRIISPVTSAFLKPSNAQEMNCAIDISSFFVGITTETSILSDTIPSRLAKARILSKSYRMAFLVCGYGLIGKQRVSALLKAGVQPGEITIVDPEIRDLEEDHAKVKTIRSIDLLSLKDYTHAIVAIPHQYAVDTVSKLLNFRIKVLMEKPMGRSIEEASRLAHGEFSDNLSIGFNYRFMPGVLKLKELLQSNRFGEIHSIKVDLGHGGKPEDKDSWKLNPVIAGGGVVLDPGIHVIDLLNFLFPRDEFDYKFASTVLWSGFWKTGIEESSFVIGKVGKASLNLSFSVVSWKTRFLIEVSGAEGYAILQGRGRTDGPQTLVIGPRWGWKIHGNQRDSEEELLNSKEDYSILNETIGWLSNDVKVASAKDALLCEQIRQEILSVAMK
jgi:predicted dehydrogenase